MIGFWIILKYIFTYFFHNLLWILIRSVQEEMVNSLHTRISTVRYGLRNITARKRSNSCQKDPSKSREKKFDRRKTLVNLKKFFRKLLEVTRVTIAGRGRGLVRPLGPLNLWCGWVFTSTISNCIENDFSNHWLKIRFLIFFHFSSVFVLGVHQMLCTNSSGRFNKFSCHGNNTLNGLEWLGDLMAIIHTFEVVFLMDFPFQ